MINFKYFILGLIIENFGLKPRPAVTIGEFTSIDSEEFKRYNKVAEILNGRYHLLYIIKEE